MFSTSSDTMVTKGVIMGRNFGNMYKWRKDNLKHYVFDLNKSKEKDVIDHLEKQANKKEYFVSLVRKDMNGTELSETAKSRQTEDN